MLCPRIRQSLSHDHSAPSRISRLHTDNPAGSIGIKSELVIPGLKHDHAPASFGWQFEFSADGLRVAHGGKHSNRTQRKHEHDEILAIRLHVTLLLSWKDTTARGRRSSVVGIDYEVR